MRGAQRAASGTTRYAGGAKRLHKAAPSPDTCDCSGRRESESRGRWRRMAQKACSLPRTKWMRRRRVVFAPKCRRKAICNQIRSDPGEIFGKLCRCKGIGIVEGHLMPDRVHMLPAMPPKCSVSSVMGYLEGEGPADDVRQAREHEVKVRQQEVPGRGPLRARRRPERGRDREAHPGAGEGRHRARPAERQGARGPLRQGSGA